MAETHNIITVKLDTSDVLKHIHLFTGLPKVHKSLTGRYWTNEGIKWTPIDSDDPYNDINTHIRALVAIKLRMEADAKKLTWGEAQQDRNDARLEELKAAEVKKATEKLTARRDALAALHCLGMAYRQLSIYSQNLVNALIAAEDAK
jgi:hypothetical protein